MDPDRSRQQLLSSFKQGFYFFLSHVVLSLTDPHKSGCEPPTSCLITASEADGCVVLASISSSPAAPSPAQVLSDKLKYSLLTSVLSARVAKSRQFRRLAFMSRKLSQSLSLIFRFLSAHIFCFHRFAFLEAICVDLSTAELAMSQESSIFLFYFLLL